MQKGLLHPNANFSFNTTTTEHLIRFCRFQKQLFAVKR